MVHEQTIPDVLLTIRILIHSDENQVSLTTWRNMKLHDNAL